MGLLTLAILLVSMFYLIARLYSRPSNLENTTWEEFERINGRAEHKESDSDGFQEVVNSPFARPFVDKERVPEE